jgi:soluble lytic murein transglycosylase-like protein
MKGRDLKMALFGFGTGSTSGTAGTLQSRLSRAQQHLASLRDQLGPLALAAATSGSPADTDALRQHREKIRAAEIEADDLGVAMAAQEAAERQQQADGLARLRESQLRVMAKISKERTAAAAEFSAAIASAIESWNKMQEANSAITAPSGLELNKALSGIEQLRAWTAEEMFRIGGRLPGIPGAPIMPGVPQRSLGDAPSKLPVLSDRLRDAASKEVRRLQAAIDAGRLSVEPLKEDK